MAVNSEEFTVEVKVKSKEAAKQLSVYGQTLTLTAAQVDRLEKENEKLQATIDKLAPSLDKVDKNLENTSTAMKNVNTAFRVFNDATKAIPEALGAAAVAAGSFLVALKFEKTAKPLLALTSGVKGAGRDFINLGKTLDNTTKGFTGLVERSNAAAIGLSLLGNTMRQADHEAVAFAGKVTLIAGLLVGGFTFAISTALSAIGNFAASIGTDIINAMTAFEKKFQKAEVVVSAFTFTIQGFVKTFGENAVGSLERWNDTLSKLSATTTFGSDDIRKAIKLIVADGKALGLTVTQMSKVLDRAADVAAANGKEIEETAGILLKAIGGTTDAAFNLGIDLRQTGLEHSKYAKSVNVSVDALGAAEKQQFRYNVLLEKTTPILGAAQAATQTITGATIQYEKALEDVQTKLGRQTDFTVVYINALKQLLTNINALPKFVFRFIGSILDLSGVLLKVMGTILAVLIPLAGLITLFKVLNILMMENVTVQIFATKVIGTTASALGVQTAAVTSTGTAWAGLTTIMRAATVQIGVSLLATISILGKRLLSLIGFVTPILLKIGALVAVFAAITVAIDEFSDEIITILKRLGILGKEVGKSSKELSLFERALAGITKVLTGVFKAMVGFVKLLLGGLASAVLLVAKGFGFLQEALADTDEELLAVEKTQLRIDSLLTEIQRNSVNTALAMSNAFGNAAIAAEGAENGLRKSGEEAKRFRETLNVLSKTSIDVKQLKLETLGDEFDQSRAAFNRANIEFNKALDTLNRAEEKTKKLIQNTASAREEAARSFLSMQRLQQDTIKSFSELETQLAIDAERNQKNFIKAVELENKVRLQNFKDTVAGLRTIGKLTQDQEKLITRLMAAIVAQGDASLEAANKLQNADILKVFEDLIKKTKTLEDAESKMGKSRQEIAKDTLVAELKRIDALQKQLEIAGLLLGKEKALDKARQAAFGKFADDTDKADKADTPRIPELFSDNSLKVLDAGLGKSVAGFAGGLGKAFAGPIGMFAAAANIILDAFQKILDFIPQLINKLAKVINTLTDLPKKILEAVLNLQNSVKRLFTDFIPNIINSLVTGLIESFDFSAMFDDLASTLGTAVMEALTRLVDSIPLLFAKAGESLADVLGGKIGLSLLTSILKGLPKLVNSLTKAIPEMIPAFVEAFIQSFIDSIQMIKDILSGAIFEGMTTGSTNAIQTLAGTLSGQSSELFQVLEGGISARGNTAGEDIRASIESATNMFRTAWQAFIDALIRVWRFVIDFFNKFGTLVSLAWKAIIEFFEGFGLMISNAWKEIIEFFQGLGLVISNIWKGLMAGIQKFFMDIWNMLLKPVAEAIQKAFTWVWNNVIQPIANVVKDAWDFLVTWFDKGFTEAILKPWKAITKWFSEKFGEKISSAWSGITTFFTNLKDKVGEAFKPILDFFKNLTFKIPGADKGQSFLENVGLAAHGGFAREIQRFANGGFAKGFDTVPAMLRPGEFVMSNQGVDALGVPALRQANAGITPSVGGGASFGDININVQTEQLDETFIKGRLADSIKETLREASVQGELLISSKGVF